MKSLLKHVIGGVVQINEFEYEVGDSYVYGQGIHTITKVTSTTVYIRSEFPHQVIIETTTRLHNEDWSEEIIPHKIGDKTYNSLKWLQPRYK